MVAACLLSSAAAAVEPLCVLPCQSGRCRNTRLTSDDDVPISVCTGGVSRSHVEALRDWLALLRAHPSAPSILAANAFVFSLFHLATQT